MKEQIKKFIYENDNVSFPQLMRAIPNSSGDRVSCHDNENLILWEGLSQPFVDAFEELLAEGSIEIKPVTLNTIAMIHSFTRDGLLDYPVAKRIHKYARPHWLPAIIQKC